MVVWSVALVIFALGGGRFSTWSYCKGWHLVHGSEIRVGEVSARIPDRWCPMRHGDRGEVSLAGVPASRTEAIRIIVITPLPEDIVERFPDAPERLEVDGDSMEAPDERTLGNLAGQRALRTRYRSGGDDGGRHYIAWIVPELRWMISTQVSPVWGEDFDEFARQLIASVRTGERRRSSTP